MGAFVVQLVDRATRRPLVRFLAPNVLAYEGMQYVYRQMFPTCEDAMTFALGVSDPLGRAKELRPNPATGEVPFGPALTFAQCTAAAANEGGGYTAGMRDSFGYSRKTVTFTAAPEADGGALACPVQEFPNGHEWLPQDGDDWDLPWTADQIEQPPPAWTPRASWEPVVGYPWQVPRKRSATESGGDPLVYVYSYMHEWDSSGDLDWLYDFRKMGGFPITMAFLADSSRSKLIAAALFAGHVLLRPGLSVHVAYQARIGGLITRDFALRFAKYAFQQTGSRYDTIYCRPLLDTAPTFTRRTTYADVSPHFHASFAAVALSSWSYVPYDAGPPVVLPRVESSSAPEWTNSTGSQVGPFRGLAVYGTISSVPELMWVADFAEPVSVPNGDTLRVPDKVQFRLEGV